MTRRGPLSKAKPVQGILSNWHMSTHDCRLVGILMVAFNNREGVTEGKPICTSRVLLIERRSDGKLWAETENSIYWLM